MPSARFGPGLDLIQAVQQFLPEPDLLDFCWRDFATVSRAMRHLPDRLGSTKAKVRDGDYGSIWIAGMPRLT